MDFYEEALSLVYSLTCSQISPTMWQVFRLIHKMFSEDGIDYFVDMMPALHNYVTVDPEAFITDPERVQIIFDMCKKVLSDDVDAGSEAECHAGKLLEVVILQYRGRIDPLLRPITEIVLTRLAREVKTSELRTMCLQVLIAGLHYNPPLMLEILNSFQPPNSEMSIIDQFVKQWLFDVDCFLGLHDRKMCIIGLTTLMGMPGRPIVMKEVGHRVLPSLVSLFDELQKAYEAKALRESKDDDSDSGEEDAEDGEGLETDEDEVDEEAHEQMEKLAKSEQDSGNDDDYSDEEFVDETDLESYETVLDSEDTDVDEYVMFKSTLMALQHTEPDWYQMLITGLSAEQQASLQNIFKLADQKFAALESKKIEKGGGYQFSVQQVPTTFNFGGSAFS
jgi:succinate dehydrogenase flavin-adding protein (antitoxin of CptAB toxin-antitoxin module)